jgi:hypothetical protein
LDGLVIDPQRLRGLALAQAAVNQFFRLLAPGLDG